MGDPPTVVVLNDDADTVEMLVQLFRSEGMTAFGDTQRRGENELASFVGQHDPDAIVFDVGLPYRQSLEKLRQLVRVACDGIPVFVTTTERHLLRGLMEDGEVQHVFLKPCDTRQLVEAIRAVIAASEG